MQQNELEHYGVKGMKWGVHRAQKKLAKASTQEQRDKAIASLNKHRGKASSKIAKLEKKRPKLEKAYDRAILKTDVKISKMEQKRSKHTRKATKLLSTDKIRSRHLAKAQIMDMKIKDLKAHSDRAKSEMAKNERLIELFNRGISDIDSTLALAGKKYING